MKYIQPELRENRGEIEASLSKYLPELIKYSDIKGDLHIHSNWSDGNNTIEELALFSIKMGYSYIGISDHSESLKIANGLDDKKIVKKMKEIDKLNDKLNDFHIFCGTECEIKKNGILDYNKNAQVIFVSADEAVREQTIALGARDFIKKPFDIHQLLIVIEKVLNLKIKI